MCFLYHSLHERISRSLERKLKERTRFIFDVKGVTLLTFHYNISFFLPWFLSKSIVNRYKFLTLKHFKGALSCLRQFLATEISCDDKCFLFHLERPFHPQDIYIFFLDFFLMQKNGLIKKMRLTSNFVRSEPRKQTIIIHILSNISRNNDSHKEI